ncbi:MAG: hypothetical protein K0R73_300 [Candidatus Midichloriaceae bacterium]|jgi:ankyrin repeat protein|nr:hypothetical protein [Candidatus Midichloriaceae bacterium]
MRELYRNFIKKNFTLDVEKEVFKHMLNVLTPQEIKRVFTLDRIKTVIAPLISAQEMYSAVAIKAVQSGKLEILKFLIEELKYDFKGIVDENNITLLHEACLYGKVEIVQLLLKAGLDPNAVDINGDTPLHRAVRTPDTQIIEILYAHKANLNKLSCDNLSPLHVAALYQNFPAITKLKSLKANIRIKTSEGLLYYELSQYVKEGKIEVGEALPLQTNFEESYSNRAAVLYYKGILSSKINHQSLQEAQKILVEHIEIIKKEANDIIAQYNQIIDIYFFTCSQKAESIIVYVAKLIKAHKINEEYAALSLLRVSLFFRTVNQAQQAELLLDYALNMTSKEEEPTLLQIEICNLITAEYNSIGLFGKGEAAAKLALSRLSGAEDNKLLAFLHYNLAYAQNYLMKHEESNDTYEKAFQLKQDDRDIFRRHIANLLQSGKYEKAKLVCSQSKCGEQTILLAYYIRVLLKKITWQDFLNKVDKDLPNLADKVLVLDFKSEGLFELGDLSGSIDCRLDFFKLSVEMMESVDQLEVPLNLGYAITKVLKTFIDCSQYEKGLAFLVEQEKQYPLEFATNYLLKAFSAIIYLGNQDISNAKKLIAEVHQINPTSPFLTSLYLNLALHALEDESSIKNSVALLKEVLILDPNNITAKIYQAFLLIMIGDKVELANVMGEVNADLLIDISLKAGLLKEGFIEKREAAETEAAIDFEEFDPIKIHEFFQAQKASILASALKELSPAPEVYTSWFINGEVINENSKGVVKVNLRSHLNFYQNHYAMISPDLRMDPNLLNKFEKALEKGLCERSLHQNGIKFLSNCIVELKIKGENRLYTDTEYKNEKGKFLIIFEQIGTHEKIKNLLQIGSLLKTLEVPSQPLSTVKIFSVMMQYNNPMIQALHNNSALSYKVAKMGADIFNKFLALGEKTNQVARREFETIVSTAGIDWALNSLTNSSLSGGKLINSNVGHNDYNPHFNSASSHIETKAINSSSPGHQGF